MLLRVKAGDYYHNSGIQNAYTGSEGRMNVTTVQLARSIAF